MAQGRQEMMNHSRRFVERRTGVQRVVFAENFVEVVDAEEVGQVIVRSAAHFPGIDQFENNVTKVVG